MYVWGAALLWTQTVDCVGVCRICCSVVQRRLSGALLLSSPRHQALFPNSIFWILFAFCIWAKHLNARVGVMIGIHFTPHVSCLALNTSARTLLQMCLNFALNCKHKHTYSEREREGHTCTHAYVCFGAHCHTHEAKNAVAQHWHLIWIRCCYCSFVCVQSAFSPPTTTFLSIWVFYFALRLPFLCTTRRFTQNSPLYALSFFVVFVLN